MSNSSNNVTPIAKYRSDYQKPSHLITSIDLEFKLEDQRTLVTARSQIAQFGDVNTLVLDGENLKLISVKIDEQSWQDHLVNANNLVLTNLPKQFQLEIITQIDPLNNTSLEGLYKSDGAFCTQCEAEGFRRITYFLDRPDVLAKYTCTIIADRTLYPYLLSNGNKIASGSVSLDGKLLNVIDTRLEKHWVTWNDPFAKPSYLFALVAGDFDLLQGNFITKSNRNVALEIFVDKGNKDRAHHALNSLVKAMKWDEERFNLEYDLDCYMIVAVDFFNMGAMENKGLNIFNSKYVLANDNSATDQDYLAIEAVIGHEYFHNWTGNRITCRNWFELSLKEGLTVFRDQEFSSDLGSRSVNRINNVRIMRSQQFAEDASPMSHPIRPEKVIEMNNFYTVTVYEKGSEVIRMCHTLLGEEKFQKGMQLYVTRFDGMAVTCDDFIDVMQEASEVDLNQFRLWYSQSGTPTLKVSSSYDAQKHFYYLTVKQYTAPTFDQKQKEVLYIPLDIALYDPSGKVLPLIVNSQKISNILDIKQAEQTFIFENVAQQPVVSLLREFSAPVSLEYDYSDAELIFLIEHAQNDFAKWDSAQILLAKYIKLNVAKINEKQDLFLPEALIFGFNKILTNENLDPAFRAQMLTLPSINEIIGWYAIVDIDAINMIVKFFKQTLATRLTESLAKIYHDLTQDNYEISVDAIGKRSLRNQCLQYLAYTKLGNELVNAQYDIATNMTDVIAAMSAANDAQLSCRERLMQDYSKKWQHDGLVMDKWFILQGSNPASNALTIIKEAMSHQAFSLTNPNRVRSLIGCFLNNNHINFHQLSGDGYLFAGEILSSLNTINPQIASRLIDPLLKLNKYDHKRRDLIAQQLHKLLKLNNLSKDLFEKITKALNIDS